MAAVVRLVLIVLVGFTIGYASRSVVGFSTQLTRSQNRKDELNPTGAHVHNRRLHDELFARFEAYKRDRTAKQAVLLDEVISVYMRADRMECIALLRQLNCPWLGREALLSVIDPGDVSSALLLASNCDGATGDELIRNAFHQLGANDPASALSRARRHASLSA